MKYSICFVCVRYTELIHIAFKISHLGSISFSRFCIKSQNFWCYFQLKHPSFTCNYGSFCKDLKHKNDMNKSHINTLDRDGKSEPCLNTSLDINSMMSCISNLMGCLMTKKKGVNKVKDSFLWYKLGAKHHQIGHVDKQHFQQAQVIFSEYVFFSLILLQFWCQKSIYTLLQKTAAGLLWCSVI